MVLGIAGGVGSGKSTVLNILEKDYHAVICKADNLGHEAIHPKHEIGQKIIRIFGVGILDSAGEIDRNKLGQIVYKDDEKMALLNGLIHPFVKKEIRRQMNACGAQRLFVLETAILFETGCDAMCDEVWAVLTSDEIRIQRLMTSRGYTREKVMDIMKKQAANEELVRKCDALIKNDEGLEELKEQIRFCMENMLEKQG